MNELAEALEKAAYEAFAAEPAPHEWRRLGSTSIRLTFPKQLATGFDVSVLAKPWGLYVEADGWHHPANWEPIGGWTPLEMCRDCLGFARTLLSTDAYLNVRYAGRSPYKWTMVYTVETRLEVETTGLLVFNYFASRRSVRLQNSTLPARFGGVVEQPVSGLLQSSPER
jgi:hypothetical protein